MKYALLVFTVFLAMLPAQKATTQITAKPAAPTTVVDGKVLSYRTTYLLGCGASMVTIPESLVQIQFVQNLGDEIYTLLKGKCNPNTRVQIFVTQMDDSLNVQVSLPQTLALQPVTIVPLTSHDSQLAKKTADKILSFKR